MPLVLLDGRELADRLGESYANLMRWSRTGKIPSIKTGRGRVVFNLDEVVNALMKARTGSSSRRPAPKPNNEGASGLP